MNDELDFEDFAACQGVNLSTATVEEKQNVENMWRAATRQKLIDRFASMNPANESQIEAAVGGVFDNGGTVRRAELEGLRAARPGSPGVYVQQTAGSTSDLLEAGLLASFGVPADFIAKEYGAKVADRTTGKNYRGLTLHGLARISLSQQGRNPGAGMLRERDLRDAFAFHAGVGGPSTYSLPNVLSNVGNKMAYKAFTDAGTTWKTFCRQSTVNDFKQRTGLRVTGTQTILQNVPKGGEIKHGTLAESTFTNQADTVGQLLGIDRRDMVNDDLSILQTADAGAKGTHGAGWWRRSKRVKCTTVPVCDRGRWAEPITRTQEAPRCTPTWNSGLRSADGCSSRG